MIRLLVDFPKVAVLRRTAAGLWLTVLRNAQNDELRAVLIACGAVAGEVAARLILITSRSHVSVLSR